MEQDLLTIKEIAKQLGVPESNIRYYRDRFEEFLPYVGEGRKRRYKQEAMEIFKCIVDGYRQEQTTEQIAQLLSHNYPRNLTIDKIERKGMDKAGLVPHPEPVQKDTLPMSLLQSQAKTLEQLSSVLMKRNYQSNELARLSLEQERMKRALISFWKEYKKFKEMTPELTSGSEKEQPGGQSEGFDTRLSSLEQEVQAVQQRQDEFQEQVRTDLTEIRGMIQKCMFWTKRLMLQSAQFEDDDGDRSPEDGVLGPGDDIDDNEEEV